jgi:hypothetical protein
MVDKVSFRVKNEDNKSIISFRLFKSETGKQLLARSMVYHAVLHPLEEIFYQTFGHE